MAMTNWSQLINDLQDKKRRGTHATNCVKSLQDKKLGNMTQKEIAECVPCSQNYISDLKTGKKGKRISHEIAEGLKRLHGQKIHPVA